MAPLSKRPRIGVIADDLTGAAEIGGIGWRYGLKAEVLIGAKAGLSPAELVCIDSDSRSCSASKAAGLAQGCAQSLQRLNPSWIYKKVDSVLRGNVLGEIEAIMKCAGFRRALLVPANPSFGRVIRDGNYYINGTPIAETYFLRDPQYPRLVSDVRKLLAGSECERVVIRKPGEVIPDFGVALGEVSSLADVRYWAQLQSPDTLCAGGAEFFTALLEGSDYGLPARSSRLPENSTAKATSQTRSRQLFVCGSICDATQQFVIASRLKGVPVFYVPHQIAAADKPDVLRAIGMEAEAVLSANERVVLSVQPPLVDNREAARQFAIDLVRIARQVLARRPGLEVFVEGGATAAELVREMGWSHFEVIEELAAGVVTLRPRQSATMLTMKPGSYSGWET